jgi:inorganic pyrophosphatase
MPPCPESPTATRIPLELDVVVEIPCGSFRKVGSSGQLDFLSPLPCPVNYGSVPGLLGLEGDLLDAVVLGPRLAAGCRVRVLAYGAVGLHDRGLYDDKLICTLRPLSLAEQRRWRRRMLRFFALYAIAKRLLNAWRGRPGRTAAAGWVEADVALARAVSLPAAGWRGPPVPF